MYFAVNYLRMPKLFSIHNATLLGFMLLHLTPVSESAPQNDLITELPGFSGAFPSKHYSGYITVEGIKHGKSKHLFYYFVESERNPSKDPLVLWLNGGPGCSSFDGFVYEHGPFNFRAGKTKGSLPRLQINPHSWSKVSNIIYLDSPAGVGLSYSHNETAYKTGDQQTAMDTHSFLLKWLIQYPEFLHNEFYISGESYAGVYVPTLAHEVVRGIRSKIIPTINFKGYLIGNGIVGDDRWDDFSQASFAHGMGLISDDFYKKIVTACVDLNSLICNNTGSEFYTYLDRLNLNVYNILEPCYNSEDHRDLAQMVDRRVMPPCTNDELARAWLNDESLRKAIHAKPVSVIGPWSICMEIDYKPDTGSMLKYHKKLTAQGYRALIYSGDHDMRVPFTGSEGWTRSLQYKIVEKWRPWMVNNQLAGFLQVYANNLTFLTMKGAGHQVPAYKPRESLRFYSQWLEERPI